jgi:hypothetical protein
MKDFKKVIKEALTPHYLRESVNENLMAKFQDALDDDQFAFFQRALDKADRGEELNQSEEQVVKYFGMVKAKYDDAIAQGMSPDEITLNPNKPINEESLDDRAKRYFIQKVSRGEIDTLPENPKEEFLAQMMKDQMDHDEETLRRERGEMSDEEEHEHVKNLLKRNFMDEAEDRVDEIDMNDPVLMKARAAQMADEKEKAKQAALDKKYGSSFMDKLDAELDLKGELEDLKQEREMIMIDMEQEAEPEGGEIADRYGERLNQIDMRIADIQEELDDLRMYESINEDLIKEFQRDGGNYRSSYQHRQPEEQLTSTDDYELFMEMFPRGEASRILMDPKRKELYDKHLEWTKEYDNNNTFVHMQYHEVEHEGELYKVHQTQYYNGNYDDFRNPRFTELMISKDGKRMGTYLVDTKEYVEDLKNLDVKKRVSESLNEEFKVGDKVTYLGHPGVITATRKDPIGRDFVDVSYDKGTKKMEVDMILAKSDAVKAVEEGTCGYTPDGEPRSKPAGPDLNEDEIPSYLTQGVAMRDAVDKSVSFNDFEKRAYNILGPKYYKLLLSKSPGILKDFYDKFHITKPNLEEESDTDVGGGAKQAIGLDIDDEGASDAALDSEVNKMGYAESKEFNFKKMIKEALTPNYLK